MTSKFGISACLVGNIEVIIYINVMLLKSHGMALIFTAFVLQTGLSRVVYLVLFCFVYILMYSLMHCSPVDMAVMLDRVTLEFWEMLMTYYCLPVPPIE